MKQRQKSEPAVGFGDAYSRGRATHTMNAFARVETRPVAGGADITVTPRRGMATMPEIEANDDGSVTIHVRKEHGPRIGERIMVRRRLVEVAERRWTGTGGLLVRDADTGAWLAVDE